MSNLKKPACAPKRDVLELATLQYSLQLRRDSKQCPTKLIVPQLLLIFVDVIGGQCICFEILWLKKNSYTEQTENLGNVRQSSVQLKMCPIYFLLLTCFYFKAGSRHQQKQKRVKKS